MLDRAHKFPLRTVPHSFQQAQKIRGRYCNIWYLPQEKTQVAVIVSKKVAASAVTRNQLRRAIYDWFQAHLAKMPSAALVVALFPRASQQNADSLLSDIEQTITRIQL